MGTFLVFLNQVLGFLQVRSLLISRVETFAFGGSDAVMSTDERYLMAVYYARFAETVLKTSALSAFQKMAVFLQFDDDDLQQLIIEEDIHDKSQIMLAVRQFRNTPDSPVISWVRDGCCRRRHRQIPV